MAGGRGGGGGRATDGWLQWREEWRHGPRATPSEVNLKNNRLDILSESKPLEREALFKRGLNCLKLLLNYFFAYTMVSNNAQTLIF